MRQLYEEQMKTKEVTFLKQSLEVEVTLLKQLLDERQQRLDERQQRLDEGMQLQAQLLEAQKQRLDERQQVVERADEATRNAKLETSLLKARLSAEANLRPMVEHLVRRWLQENKEVAEKILNRKLKRGVDEGLTAMLESDIKNKHGYTLKQCIEFAAADGKWNPVYTLKRVNQLYAEMSKEAHDPELPGYLKGFVIGKDREFSSAASGLFRYCSTAHTVMDKNYMETLYVWPHTMESDNAIS
jgi:exonuclease VII large subunit